MKLSADKKTLINVLASDLDPNGAFIIPESVTEIGECAFEDCHLTSISIPNRVTKIANGAFACSGLTSIIIPESVTNIGYAAFFDCINLTTISMPNGLTKIEDSTFRGCTNLTSIIIPKSVTTIADNAFFDCRNLTSISIPHGVTKIGTAFQRCSSLAYITLPEHLTEIGNGAFNACTGLTNIIIPEHVTELGNGAFSSCSALTSISIPNRVTKIRHHTFSGCASLHGIIIPEGTTEIGVNAFIDCKNLLNVVINTMDESVFEKIKRLLPEELKRHVVSMSVYAQAKQLKEQLIDDFCNHTSGINPLDGHERLPADVIGVISAWSDKFSPASRLRKSLDQVLMPTRNLVSEYERYEMALKQMQDKHVALVSLYVELNPLYSLKNHLLKYQQIMETPSEKPSSVRPIDFFCGRRPNEHSNYLSTWIRHQALTKILDWIKKIIDNNLLLADVPDLALSTEEKTAIRSSQVLMKDAIIPADFDFKAMIVQKDPPNADAAIPSLN